jgi:hypothetical protein
MAPPDKVLHELRVNGEREDLGLTRTKSESAGTVRVVHPPIPAASAVKGRVRVEEPVAALG